MRKKLVNSVRILFILCALLVSLVSCEKKKSTFKIGFCGALTGASAAAGKSALAGIQQAVNEINENGGINGMSVEFVYRDDESDATKNYVGVEELIDKEKVDLIFGAVNSGSASASLEIINEAKKITLER